MPRTERTRPTTASTAGCNAADTAAAARWIAATAASTQRLITFSHQ